MVDRWVVDLNTLYVVVCGVVLIEHRVGNVGDVLASITDCTINTSPALQHSHSLPFTSNVHLIPLHGEQLNEVLPESRKLLANNGFIHDTFSASFSEWRKASSDCRNVSIKEVIVVRGGKCTDRADQSRPCWSS